MNSNRPATEEPRMERIIDWTRDEADACQANTPGCAIDHTAEQAAGRREGGCEGW